jgi:23S rRNA (guanosine2251-2'-O)-methyltransferase
MKHTHRPHRHRSGGFAKGPHKGRRNEAENPFRKPERQADRPRRPEKPAPREGILLWGVHAVKAAWLSPKRKCLRLWTAESGLAAFEKTIIQAKQAGLTRPEPKRVERHELDRLLPPGSVHQGIVLEAAALPDIALHEIIDAETPPDLVLALDQVTDPHNVGAIARSAAAFGAGAIVMTERNAPGLTGVLAKSASGAIEHVPLIHIVNLARAIEELQQAGYWCVGLAEEGAKELSACDLTGRTALILGAEGEGLRQLTRKKCDELARLPTQGPIGSLNVSNAAAVALYEVRRQKNKF